MSASKCVCLTCDTCRTTVFIGPPGQRVDVTREKARLAGWRMYWTRVRKAATPRDTCPACIGEETPR